jgi:hypothetical protein
MPAGRPTDYSEVKAKAICTRIANGESLSAICKEKNTPSIAAVFVWLGKYPKFKESYARAREQQAEYYANEIIDIADEMPTCEVPDPDGGVSIRVDAAGVQRNRLRVDARKWYASKVAPKTYGDKIQAELSGELGIRTVILASEPKNSVPRPALSPVFDESSDKPTKRLPVSK